MTFTSVEYLLFFFAVFSIYWIICRKSKDCQNLLIVLASLFFYGWWDWRFLGLLLITVLTTFLAGYLIQKWNKQKKLFLIFTIIINVGLLFFFKYYNFFIESFVDAFKLFGLEINASTLKIILPIGISFYTFSALSYIIDIYQGKILATKDILSYSAYVMFFPSILSGPINRATSQLPQYYTLRHFNYENSVEACKIILLGGVMKACLADRLGIYVDAVYSHIYQHNGSTLLLTSILYTIQIYADFAGYSLMAIGFGKLLGIELQTNFIRPYFSKTITEFWRKWHISLTTWFRDYIYFPLGGSRVSRGRWIINTMIVFIVSGLWHGAAYTFLIWGAFHGICMIIERMLYGKRIKEIPNKITPLNMVRIIITFCLVSFAWIFFRAESLPDAMRIIKSIATDHGNVFFDTDTLSMAFISFVVVFAYDFVKEYKLNVHLLSSKHTVVQYLTILFLICFILTFGVLDNGSFIYFQF